MTLLVTVFVIIVALVMGVLVGRRRSPVVGIVSGSGILATGALVYCVLLSLALAM